MDQGISFTDELVGAVRTLWLGRKTVAVVALSAVAVSVVVSLIVPHGYRARTTFLATQEQGNNLASQLAAAGAAIPGGLLSLPPTPVDVFREVLESRAVRQGVIDKLHLLDRFGIENQNPAVAREHALSRLQGMLRIATKRSGLLAVEVTAQTPWFPFFHPGADSSARGLSAEIGNEMVRQLNQVLQERRSSSARNSRIYLEDQLKKSEHDLEVASDSLVAYQKRHATISIDDQTRVAVETLGSLRGQIIAKEVERDVIRKNQTPDSYELQRVETELSALNRQYEELVRGSGGAGSEDALEMTMPMADLPDVAMELLRRTRDVELQHTVYELLTTQYYQAKLDEARDLPTVQVLDEAVPPIGKASPRRRVIVILAFLGGCFVGTALVLIRDRQWSRSLAAGARAQAG